MPNVLRPVIFSILLYSDQSRSPRRKGKFRIRHKLANQLSSTSSILTVVVAVAVIDFAVVVVAVVVVAVVVVAIVVAVVVVVVCQEFVETLWHQEL